MATKIIQLQEKTASGYDELIPERAIQADSALRAQQSTNAKRAEYSINATIGVYASPDSIGKGSIEQRLTALETTQEGAIANLAGTASTNNLEKRAGIVLGRLILTLSNFQPSNTIGIVPEGFRPTANIEIRCSYPEIASASGAISFYYGALIAQIDSQTGAITLKDFSGYMYLSTAFAGYQKSQVGTIENLPAAISITNLCIDFGYEINQTTQ